MTVAHDAASSRFDPTQSVSTPTAPGAEPVHVGYVGNLYEGRGIEMIIEAAKHLPALTFDIIGGRQNDLAALRSRAIPTNVILHGFVAPADLPGFYERLDIVLLPHQTRAVGASGRTNIAPFCSPLKLFEYMASGKAVVASDLPVLREVLVHQRNALLVAPDDLPGWVSAIETLADNPHLRTGLGKAARADFEAQFTWEVCASAIANGGRSGNRSTSVWVS